MVRKFSMYFSIKSPSDPSAESDVVPFGRVFQIGDSFSLPALLFQTNWAEHGPSSLQVFLKVGDGRAKIIFEVTDVI